jgi:hypothetical protein
MHHFDAPGVFNLLFQEKNVFVPMSFPVFGIIARMFYIHFFYLFAKNFEDRVLDETKLSQRHNDVSYHGQLNNLYASTPHMQPTCRRRQKPKAVTVIKSER